MRRSAGPAAPATQAVQVPHASQAACAAHTASAVLFRALVLALLVAAPASAQSIRGRVVDAEADRPLPLALVSVVDADTTMIAAALSDSTGAFAFEVPDADTMWIRVEAYGYEPVESRLLAFVRGEPLLVDFLLRPRPLQLETVTARAERQVEDNLAAFLHRRENRFGRFLGPLEIAEIQPRSGDLLLASVPGIRRDYEWGSGFYAIRRPAFGPGFGEGPGGQGSEHLGFTAPARGCTPTVYLDGRVLDEFGVHDVAGGPSMSVDWYAPLKSIRAAEVYLEPRDAPARFHRGYRLDCGIILLWTDRGFGFAPPKELASASE